MRTRIRWTALLLAASIVLWRLPVRRTRRRPSARGRTAPADTGQAYLTDIELRRAWTWTTRALTTEPDHRRRLTLVITRAHLLDEMLARGLPIHE